MAVNGLVFVDHFSGPSRAIGPVCVFVYVSTTIFELSLNDL